MASDPFRQQLESKLETIVSNPELLKTLDPRVLTKMYLHLRAIKRDRDAASKAYLKPVKDAMGFIEAFLLDHLNKQGAESVKTADGTFFKKTRRYIKITSWDDFVTWAKQGGYLRMLKKDVSSTEIAAYMDAHPDDPLPPGIKVTSEDVINVNKPKK